MNKSIQEQITRKHIEIGELLALDRALQDYEELKQQTPPKNTVYLPQSHFRGSAWLPQNTNTVANQNAYVNIHATSDKHIDNYIRQSAKNFFKSKEEEEEFMRLNKGMRKRKDGRYDWRKTVNHVAHYLIHTNPHVLAKMVQEYKKENLKNTTIKKPKESKKFIDLAWSYYHRYKEGKIKSSANYISLLNKHICKLEGCVSSYTKNDIQDFLNNIQGTRVVIDVYDFVKCVFIEALEAGYIKKNPIATLKRPRNHRKKGTWLKPMEQQKLLACIDTSKIGLQVLFFLMTGARLGEAFNTTIDFEKHIAFIDGTKSQTSSRYVELSSSFCEIIKPHWNKMFKYNRFYYTKEFTNLAKKLDIKATVHSLRHTFSSNLYYLGIPDKRRQGLLGHASIVMTNDIYTTLDPSIKRQDILNIYGDLYPNF